MEEIIILPPKEQPEVVVPDHQLPKIINSDKADEYLSFLEISTFALSNFTTKGANYNLVYDIKRMVAEYALRHYDLQARESTMSLFGGFARFDTEKFLSLASGVNHVYEGRRYYEDILEQIERTFAENAKVRTSIFENEPFAFIKLEYTAHLQKGLVKDEIYNKLFNAIEDVEALEKPHNIMRINHIIDACNKCEQTREYTNEWKANICCQIIKHTETPSEDIRKRESENNFTSKEIAIFMTLLFNELIGKANFDNKVLCQLEEAISGYSTSTFNDANLSVKSVILPDKAGEIKSLIESIEKVKSMLIKFRPKKFNPEEPKYKKDYHILNNIIIELEAKIAKLSEKKPAKNKH